MQIAIDASRTTIQRRTGTENYALQMILHLLKIADRHEVHLYFRDVPPDELIPGYPNVVQHVIPFRRAWTHLRFAKAISSRNFDIIWVPAHTLPFVFRGRAVVTVHDLGYKHFPEAHPQNERRYLDLTTRYSAWRAQHILADSQATRDDLVRFYGISADKIRVVYPGVDESLHPVAEPASVRAKYGLPFNYLLFLGTLQPRKNIERLVVAFQRWREESGNDNVVLALGGKKGWLFDEAWVENAENVKLLGFVDDTDVAALYSGARGFLFPSLFEGFGFPVLESMRCGTNVLCSNTSSLPELVGDAAILVDPLDVGEISRGIDKLINDDALNANLRYKAAMQVQKFTWEEAAKSALAVLEEAGQ